MVRDQAGDREIANVMGVTRQTVQNWVSDLEAQREEAREEIREKALEMRAEGKSLRQVASELEVNPVTVAGWKKRSMISGN
ncbi:Homeodomain-like domain-containing protein [Desulfotomaculum arcticum]|uniref:Homeodomain-like domain-containing protein n=1 Tax=Desulfotruncus arcticus DSM 17038 TaxID=1121424 RepID=A0A1I2Y9M1_9FIRM|nr:helix-turn-helix domain-containing protein [Desulfotruncus arcticus]SFH22067.1 Homeodomain-like domain-containing protein [Desulfotomaculum arcticum] [Desulfotruncus arcticus DSM 17038]